jgi:hypothetical protein
VADLTCPFGHPIPTHLRPGSEVTCKRCREESGDAVTAIVPGDGPPGAPAPRMRPPEGAWTDCTWCRAWSWCPAGQVLPPGWVVLTVGTADRGDRTLGPFCGLPCARRALRATEPEGHLRALMTEPPARA